MKKRESTRPWKSLHHRAIGRNDYGQFYDLAAVLLDGPKSLDQIIENYLSYLRLIGVYTTLDSFRYDENEFAQVIMENLDELLERGWVEVKEDKWLLTEIGENEAKKTLRDIHRSKKVIEKISQPESVSKVSVVVHLFLASIKLPAAYLSGSVGLLNDSIDTLLDGLSSIFVYLGIKYDKEKIVNIFLTLLMVLVAALTMKESVLRILRPNPPQVDLFTFGATLVSALFCGILYFYQGYIGSKTGSISLITQSIDSRNHVIIAFSVTAGLIGTITGYAFIDTIVGFGVALLIFQSALELVRDLVKDLGNEESSVSSFKLPFKEKITQFRREQLRDYLLYQINKNQYTSLDELKILGQQAYDFSTNPLIKELGLEIKPMKEYDLDNVISKLIDDDLIKVKPIICLTGKGFQQLNVRLRKRKNTIM